jgi:hypothetical protein
MKDTRHTGISSLLRSFSITSLAAIAIIAIALILFHRQVSIAAITTLGEENNKALANIILNSLRSPLAAYLESVAQTTGKDAPRPRLTPDLEQAIQDALKDTRVVRLKLYSRHGIVVFSTLPSQIGRDQSDNPGFIAAMGGEVGSKFPFRDSLGFLSKKTDQDNLVSSYLPVRSSSSIPRCSS